MNLFQGLVSLLPRRTVYVAKATFGDIQASRVARPTASGVGDDWARPIYGDYYAQSVPAYRAIKLRADAVAQAPLRIYRRLSDKEIEPVEHDHPVQELLNRVNDWWTNADLWRATETYLSIWGSAFWFLERDGGTEVKGIWPLRPDKMRIVPDRRSATNNYIAGFRYGGLRKEVPLAPNEVVWFRYFNPLDEYAGLSPIAAGRMPLDMGKAALQYNREFFRHGAIPQDLMFYVKGPVIDEEIEAFYARLEARHQGTKNAHKPMIWDLSASDGVKPERLGLSQRDMEFMAALNFTVEDAARIWGVPPPKMYSQTQSVYNNVRQADIEFYTDTISTEWRFLEAEVNELLLPNLGAVDADLIVRFDTSQVLPLQEALAELHDRERLDVQAGILTSNEVRAGRGLPPVPWGDAWWTSMIMAPVAGATQDVGKASYRLYVGKAAGEDAVMDRAAATLAARLDTENGTPVYDLQAVLQRLFRQQKDEVVTALRKRLGAGKGAWYSKDLADEVFRPDIWHAIFRGATAQIILDALAAAAADQASVFDLDPLNVDAPGVQQWLTRRLAYWTNRVNAETAQLLLEELHEGGRIGESIPQLEQRIAKVFDFSIGFRTERIARTEILAASNRGHIELYRQSGVVTRKMWVAAMDERTRATHAAAHRQTVALDGKFVVGSEQVDHPGEGSPGNSINCRCTLVPIIQREARYSNNGHQASPLDNAVTMQEG